MYSCAKFMMLQTKHKYFNKNIKILLLILMWTLICQHVYGKSSTYDDGTSTGDADADAAATHAAPAVYDSGNDANGSRRSTNEENAVEKQIIKMATRTTTTTATTSSSTTTENEGNNNNSNNNNISNNATIYDHINENDNNSNKLPQNVATKRDQQRQPKMMKIVEIPPLPLPPPPPPTEQRLMMVKDQLNNTEDKIPKDKDDYDDFDENKQEESKELKMSMAMAKVNDIITGTISSSNSYSSITIDHQNNDKRLTRNINEVTTESNDNNDDDVEDDFAGDATTTVSSFIVPNNVYRNDTENFNTDAGNDFGSSEIDRNNENSGNNLITIALLQQQLIYKFAIKYKKIPRVTLFTCKKASSSSMDFNDSDDINIYKRQTNINILTVQLLKHMYSSDIPKVDIMIRIVHIDHLVSKRRTQQHSPIPRGGGGGYGMRGGMGRDRSAGGPTSRNTFTNANWLEQILRDEALRQIVVLDLSCGAGSRRLLEMASNKALFNSMYHWLLMEDYVFNRQTEIDDANDIKNKMNSNSKSTGSAVNSSTSRSSSKEEVVNDSKSTMQVKKLSTYISDVVGASTSGSVSSLPGGGAAAGNRQPQRSIRNDNTAATSSTGESVGDEADEDDMEIIEKFLEKLNININTELILAKRRMRGIMATSSHSDAAPSIMLPSLTNSASLESDDYNTLQKMDYYMLYDVWSPGRQYGGELNISEIGHFTHNQGVQIANWFRKTSTVIRRLNMDLAKIRCLVVITHKNRTEELEDYLTIRSDTHLDSMNRFNFALLSHVRDLFNFSFILSKTSTWGYLKNGKFDGMIGALVRKQADIGGSPIFFRIERAKVIDYTTRTWVARPCFIFRHPRSTKKDRIVFLQPFSNDVWILLAMCGFMTIIILWILTSLERKYEPDEDGTLVNTLPRSVPATSYSAHSLKPTGNAETTKKSIKKGELFKRYFVRWGSIFCGQDVTDNNSKRRVGLFFESFLFYIGSICQQGLSFSTRFFSGRCIVITSLLFAFSIYQFYSASIVGTLLMEKPKTIRTLRDLIHSSLEIGIEDIVYNRDYFLRTKDPDAQELYAKKVTSIPTTGDTGFVDAPPDSVVLPTAATELTVAQKAKAYRDILHSHETGAHAKTNEASNWYDPEFGVGKIKKGRFAFHVDVATAYKIIADTFSEKEICDLTEVQLFPPQKMVSIVQKGSPLRKVITYGLRRVTEVGLMDYQRKVWHSPKPRCVKQLHTDDLKVDMQTFTSALLVLIFGYAVSLLILGLEIMHYKLWQRYTATTS